MSKARARRLKRKIKEGRPTLAPDEYKRRRQQQEEGERRNRQILQQKRLFPAPADLEREKFEEYAPGLCCDLREHKTIRTTQNDTPYRARAIWFNDFDERHTFHKKHRQARQLYNILVHRLIKGGTLHSSSCSSSRAA
ncbi:hypothetical protein CLAFUW4_04377 [Fulvia fulva]|uniref:Uncharacterized protein n=1 Tax=Passalora fulva TaxID=5499 RepID=A0A9Q8LFE4_PASFU|nr:uncharacterized protein CLAFUR5_04340 [Fulvia fulva]KAK4626786.1 hypothetical protein CLAFUR4_04363 [Fulvia fulva]KAK4628558.1 hypothetical protein CLAFUR0_04364 [Fulvia fulva]UJO16421.1 hypothetical protein CLAFUR5_04340 [Fulvia fulva]WPV14264.1 hypothetical protein CLAFUW4_04377 [Fulvia fulva]WPV29117.1 hypothetical protein CLAFUW7_04366 [Fulvia fulva]